MVEGEPPVQIEFVFMGVVRMRITREVARRGGRNHKI